MLLALVWVLTNFEGTPSTNLDGFLLKLSRSLYSVHVQGCRPCPHPQLCSYSFYFLFERQETVISAWLVRRTLKITLLSRYRAQLAPRATAGAPARGALCPLRAGAGAGPPGQLPLLPPSQTPRRLAAAICGAPNRAHPQPRGFQHPAPPAVPRGTAAAPGGRSVPRPAGAAAQSPAARDGRSHRPPRTAPDGTRGGAAGSGSRARSWLPRRWAGSKGCPGLAAIPRPAIAGLLPSPPGAARAPSAASAQPRRCEAWSWAKPSTMR